MIPWSEFKTPQDAYTWAKKNDSNLLIFWNPFAWRVWSTDGPIPTDCVLPVRR